MKMLTGKDVRDATDYVNAGSDYWAVVAERLNEKLRAGEKPELGSGALREALEQIRRTPKMPFPDAGAHSWQAYADALSRAYNRIQAIAAEALSPSSPIEPNTLVNDTVHQCADKLNEMRDYGVLGGIAQKLGLPISDSVAVAIIVHAQELIRSLAPTSQASSEIREAADAIATCLDALNEQNIGLMKAAIRHQLAALAPSRQGAGGK